MLEKIRNKNKEDKENKENEEKEENPLYPIPTTIEDIEKQFLNEMDNHDNGDRLLYLLLAGIKENHEKIKNMNKWLKFIIPASIGVLSIIVSVIIAVFG